MADSGESTANMVVTTANAGETTDVLTGTTDVLTGTTDVLTTDASSSSSATTGPSLPECDACGADEICLETLDTHTCNLFGETHATCKPNPLGCVASDPCSIACQDICGVQACGWGPVPECPWVKGALHCWSYQGRPEWACDIWEADDCVPGKKCVPFDSESGGYLDWSKCVPVVDPAKVVGEACASDGEGGDDCEAGAFCLWGTCVALCVGTPGSPDCAVPENTCAVLNDGFLPVCLPRCDPLAPACADGEVCVPAEGGEQEFFCTADASGSEGQAVTFCSSLNACDPGLLCLPNEEVSVACMDDWCCTPVCDLEVASACPEPDQTCVEFYPPGEAPEGYESVGYCGIPG